MNSRLILCLVLIIPALCFGQTNKPENPWSLFKKFEGKWIGPSTGEPGIGKYERSYQPIFNGTFLEINNKSTYVPTAKNPSGEVHEDRGYISYDKTRKAFILRQFHIEGFVNQYKLESVSDDKNIIVFITENIENIPAGYKAKETYTWLSPDEFIETFEIAEPGKGFELYSKATLKRVK